MTRVLPGRRYNQQEGRTALEVLQDFPSAAPPLEWLLESCPLLRPRYFSISSSPALRPRQAHVTAAVVKWTTPYKRAKEGLCTSRLAALRPERGASAAGNGAATTGEVGDHTEGDASCSASTSSSSGAASGSAARGGWQSTRVPVWVEKGALRLPESDATPLILVGPGTGVAPFRSFLEHRFAALRGGGPPAAASTLFFGYRNCAGDFLYEAQWREYEASGVLRPEGGLVTAFSRDQPAKVYVTHRIREHGAALWRLIAEGGAAIYVSGSAQKMPSDVAAAFAAVFQEHGGMDAATAQKFLRQLEIGKRYNVEAWS